MRFSALVLLCLESEFEAQELARERDHDAPRRSVLVWCLAPLTRLHWIHTQKIKLMPTISYNNDNKVIDDATTGETCVWVGKTNPTSQPPSRPHFRQIHHYPHRCRYPRLRQPRAAPN